MFEMDVKIISPMEHETDVDKILVKFLWAIGYLKIDPDRDYENSLNSIPYRLFKECFLIHSDRAWTVEELISYLDTSRPTLYRHLNKLKSLDIIEEMHEGITKRYRLRYGDISKAWNFVDANVKIAMENYRIIVEKISELMKK